MREVSGVVSGSFAARGSWPARATFYGGRRPATVGEEGCGGWEKSTDYLVDVEHRHATNIIT